MDYTDTLGDCTLLRYSSLQTRMGLPNNECGLRAFIIWLRSQEIANSHPTIKYQPVTGYATIKHSWFSTSEFEFYTGWCEATVRMALNMLKEHGLLRGHPGGRCIRIDDGDGDRVPIPNLLLQYPSFFGNDIAGVRALNLIVSILIPEGLDRGGDVKPYFYITKNEMAERLGWSLKQVTPALKRCIDAYFVDVERGSWGVPNKYRLQPQEEWEEIYIVEDHDDE